MIPGSPAVLAPFAVSPVGAWLTSSVVPAAVSRTKTSRAPFPSFATRFEAADWNTTTPSFETEAASEAPFSHPPPCGTLARTTVPASRSAT